MEANKDKVSRECVDNNEIIEEREGREEPALCRIWDNIDE